MLLNLSQASREAVETFFLRAWRKDFFQKNLLLGPGSFSNPKSGNLEIWKIQKEGRAIRISGSISFLGEQESF